MTDPCRRCGGAVALLFAGPPEIIVCSSCGAMARRVFPDAPDRESSYQDDYYAQGTAERFVGLAEAASVWLKEGRAEAVAGRIPGGRSILDIGCGRGEMLERFAKRGWKVLGTQLSRTAATAAKELRGVDVVVGEVTDLGLPDASFDVVTMFHVLEHLESPDSYLREARRLLTPGGLMVVEIPDFGDPFFRLLGARHFCVDSPNHLWFLTEKVLASMLRDAGFVVEGRERFSFEYSPFSQLQNLLNFLPGEPSRFYHALMGNEEGRMLRKEPATWVHAALAALLAFPALMLSIVLPLVGPGNTVRLYARRAEQNCECEQKESLSQYG